MSLRSIVFALLAAAASLYLPAGARAQSVTYSYSYQGPPLPILRNSADIITIANIFVPKAIRISKVTATVEIDYPRPGDLNIFMYSPILTRTKLLERNCGSQGSVANVTFDDGAPSRYSDACPAGAGSFRGNEPLSNYNDQTSLGTWSLAVENNGSDDFIGYLRGFTVTITGTAVTTKPITGPYGVYNAAGFQWGAVAPGEMINIEGVNLGPSPAVAAPAGDLPTSLGGVQVTFDGAPAPISYASPYILTVQVPFNLQPGSQTAIRIVYQNNTSDPVTLDVVGVLPGLYTLSGNSSGAVNAINPDGTINSLTHPAPKGGYVILYASGLGTLNPGLDAGKTPPASPLSTTTSGVTAVVDGSSANVSFAGAAPGYPGLYQVNLQVPAGARSGTRNLTMFIGGAVTQFGVTIFVQ